MGVNGQKPQKTRKFPVIFPVCREFSGDWLAPDWLLRHLPLNNGSPDLATAGFFVVLEGYAEQAIHRPQRQKAWKRSLWADILWTC